MIDKKEVFRDTSDIFVFMNRLMVLKIFVDKSHEPCDLGSHPVLGGQLMASHSTVYHSLKQRHIEVVFPCQTVHSRIWPQLLVIPNKNQMLCSLSQRCYDVGLKDFSSFFNNDNSWFDYFK